MFDRIKWTEMTNKELNKAQSSNNNNNINKTFKHSKSISALLANNIISHEQLQSEVGASSEYIEANIVAKVCSYLLNIVSRT